mgnify:CR=1 FL=1
METIRGSIYDYPKYYDVLFGADCAAEMRFLQAAFRRYARRRVRRVFEPACGTGRMLIRLSNAGYAVSGLDLNPKAVEYCNRRFLQAGKKPVAAVGDMTDFSLPRPCDAAYNAINSFRHVAEERGAVGHFRCMAEAVAPGGIYVIGLHLTPNRPPQCTEEAWVARRGMLQVNSLMRSLSLDRRKRRERVRLQFDVYTPRQCFRIVDEFDFRTYTAEQFCGLLRKTGGWEIAAVHDFRYDIDDVIPLDDYTEDAVFVLRRTEREPPA